MAKWTILWAFMAIAFGIVKTAPSAPTIIRYYDENSETGAETVRTPLRIFAAPRRPRGSITYLTNNIEQQSSLIPQRLSPVATHNRYSSNKVTRIEPVRGTYSATDAEVSDPVKQSLAASPLRLLPLLPVSYNRISHDNEPQKKYFGTSNYVDEYVEPFEITVSDEPSTVQVAPAPAVHFNYETSFAGKTYLPIKSKVSNDKKVTRKSNSAYKIDEIKNGKSIIDELSKLDKYRLKSSEDKSDSSSSSESEGSSSSSEEDGTSSSSEEDSSEENGATRGEDSDEDEKDAPELTTNFYSQVRYQAVNKNQPSPLNDVHVNEKIKTKKTGIVYSEQGYNDKSFDQGRFSKLYEVHQRYRRDASNPTQEASWDNIEVLPIPLALEKVNSIASGEELLKYLQDLIYNSSQYLSDDDDDDEQNNLNTFTSLLNSTEIKNLIAIPEPLPETPELQSLTEKYPFQQILTNTALRYAENPMSFPRSGKTYYSLKRKRKCENISWNLNREVPLNNNKSVDTKRFNSLGEKIDCLKKRHFDEDPFDNPLFNEEFVSQSTDFHDKGNTKNINSKILGALDHASNPSVNVYHDVRNNIRLAIIADQANVKDRNQIEILKLKSKVVDSESSDSTNVKHLVEKPNTKTKPTAKDGIFDISKFIPRSYYDQKNGILYAVRHKKKKKKKKKLSDAIRKNQEPTASNVRQPNRTLTSWSEDEKIPPEHSGYRNSRRKSQKPILPYNQPSFHFHPTRTGLSSGYYPYAVLANSKKRFHYQLLRNTQ